MLFTFHTEVEVTDNDFNIMLQKMEKGYSAETTFDEWVRQKDDNALVLYEAVRKDIISTLEEQYNYNKKVIALNGVKCWNNQGEFCTIDFDEIENISAIYIPTEDIRQLLNNKAENLGYPMNYFPRIGLCIWNDWENDFIILKDVTYKGEAL